MFHTIIFLLFNFFYVNCYPNINNNINKYYINDECILPNSLLSEIRDYQPIVDTIVENVVKGKYAGETWSALAELTDKFGSRMTGSQALEDSIDYLITKMNDAGLDNVHTENATVPHWIRGYEYAEMLMPRKHILSILGLGSTIGTPRGGIIADAIAVESFDEFEKLPESLVAGKIVIFVPVWVNYSTTVKYRSASASIAAKKGAVATLIRSITPFSINSPHTGMQNYQDNVKKIPTACITVEDALMLLRMYRNGEKIKIHLEMDDRNLEPIQSRNTIAELKGTSSMKSVVVVSGHLDSWDVGVGAMDDGGGAFISWKAIEFLKSLNIIPKRTIRAILWTAEEQGYVGANEYLKAHKSQEKEEFNFFFESDIGTFEPYGLDFTGNADAECIFREILKLMAPLNTTEFKKPADGGPDISLWLNRGFPGASLLNRNEKYFWYHHSAGDSMLVEDSVNLDKAAALWAAASFIIADLSMEMPKDLD